MVDGSESDSFRAGFEYVPGHREERLSNTGAAAWKSAGWRICLVDRVGKPDSRPFPGTIATWRTLATLPTPAPLIANPLMTTVDSDEFVQISHFHRETPARRERALRT